jgi:hypothetical protein
MFNINNVNLGLVPNVVFGEVSSYMVNSRMETTSCNKDVVGVLICYRMSEEGEDLWGFRPNKMFQDIIEISQELKNSLISVDQAMLDLQDLSLRSNWTEEKFSEAYKLCFL